MGAMNADVGRSPRGEALFYRRSRFTRRVVATMASTNRQRPAVRMLCCRNSAAIDTADIPMSGTAARDPTYIRAFQLSASRG
jgi:hypothetical protein